MMTLGEIEDLVMPENYHVLTTRQLRALVSIAIAARKHCFLKTDDTFDQLNREIEYLEIDCG